VPLVQKDFFWFQTEDGKVIPAFLNERSPISTQGAIETDVIFWHYLPGEETDSGRKILPGQVDCLSSFIKGAPLVLATHGFSSSHTGGFGTSLRGGFANRSEPFNLVFINWSKRSTAPDYAAAVRNVPPVGEYITTLVHFLVEQGVASLDQTYFIGHSLGAHIANHVSINLNGGKMRTIFALDPAWPLFDRKEDDERIDPSDAHFVAVIHTSIGYLGFQERRGHVDFYPNSGRQQPGCGVDLVGSCSHSRVYALLGESIGSPEAFPSCKCNNWKEFDEGACSCVDNEKVFMGWETPSTVEGTYYLRTNGESPYGQYQ